jgi:hypothetical protein
LGAVKLLLRPSWFIAAPADRMAATARQRVSNSLFVIPFKRQLLAQVKHETPAVCQTNHSALCNEAYVNC